MMDQNFVFEQEIISKDESAIIEQIICENLKTLSRYNGITQRGQHAHHHACIKARFTVLPNIPTELNHGVFFKPQSFEALVRFSNGMWRDERRADAHGMAIKLLGVLGKKILPGREFETCQDFVLVDHPVYFTATLQEYLIFNKYFTKTIDFLKNWKSFQGFIPRLVGMIQASVMLRFYYRELFNRAREFSNHSPYSPLGTNYWSTTPYLLGQSCSVKYMARSRQQADGIVTSVDGLSQILRSHLKSGAACFEFGVHIQDDKTKQPIEDATVDWGANGARFVKLAILDIPQQEIHEFDSSNNLAENLEFSPWNSLPQHRPLGAINRARRDIYLTMAKLRHEANGISRTTIG